MSKPLRISQNPLKPIPKMGSFTFIAGRLFRNNTVSEIHLVLWREKSQNLFTAKVRIFYCFAQRSKLVFGFAGFQVIYSLLLFMRLQ
jgi:hypothetical protein